MTFIVDSDVNGSAPSVFANAAKDLSHPISLFLSESSDFPSSRKRLNSVLSSSILIRESNLLKA